MRTHVIGVLATSFVLALAGFSPCPAEAQIRAAEPAVQAPASEPIGKVVTATGAVTIEHADAIVVQANVSGQAVSRRLAILSTGATWSRPAPMAG